MQKIFWFILALASVELADFSQTASPIPPFADEGIAVYVVRVISAPSTQREAFVACLAQNDLPFWRSLKEKGLVAKVSVFETSSVVRSEPGTPEWNYLVLSQLAEGANADSLLQAIENRKDCEKASGAEVRRVETMRTTPTCNNARSTPADDLKARELKVVFNLEYIAVKDTPEALNRYRNFMSLYECLGDNSIIRDGLVFGGVALETVKVNYTQPDMPDWNQIHCFGFILGKAAAAGKAQEAARNALLPAGVVSAWEAEHAAIGGIRTQPRIDRARELFELAVR